MELNLETVLTELTLLEPQCHRNIVVFPLLSAANHSPDYVTLSDAIPNGSLTVTEISNAGSVPELLAINHGDRPVLLLDGEELIGAKQNRTLNTTILLKERTETRIPVSCVERGRWSSVSPSFSSSEHVMERKARARKVSSVSASLAASAGFASDQGMVWNEISMLQCKAAMQSPTDAMHDVFESTARELDQCLETFRCVPGQQGLLVVVDGEVAGFDLISRDDAYSRLHAKLVKSYVLDAILEKDSKPGDPVLADIKAREFLEQAGQCRPTRHPSAGYGVDCRFAAPQVAGSCLWHDGCVIHSAFFRLPASDAREESFASLSQRRRRFVG